MSDMGTNKSYLAENILMGRKGSKIRNIQPESACCLWLIFPALFIWWFHRVQKVSKLPTKQENTE